MIEIGSFIAGPFCGQLLADHGADVIKIEPPCRGDAMRDWGATLYQGNSLWWQVIARNKRLLGLNLRTSKGRQILSQLLASADVLVENFRPGTLEKWGLAPSLLHSTNPQLIIARVSGFGQTGPYATRAGFGAIAEAMAGMRNLNGFPDLPPPRMGLSIGDSLAGLFAMIGILLALRERETSGQGQVIDLGITDAVLAVMEGVLIEHSATGATRSRAGTALKGIAPSNLYPTADGQWVVIAGNADGVFRRLTKAMGREDLAENPRFSSHRRRAEHQDELDMIVAEWTRKMRLSDLLSLLETHSVPAGPLATEAAVVADEHFRFRESIVDVQTHDYGVLAMQGVVPRLSRTPGSIRWTGRAVGQDTEAILTTELGYDARAISELRREGII